MKDNEKEIQKLSHNVLRVTFPNVLSGFEQWFLLSSDRHHDSPHCNRELELEHLEQARERGGYVLDFGDIFDAMQGKYDPRRNYPDMREEYLTAMIKKKVGYLDCIIDDAAKFYGPYADRWLLMAQGNHETAILSHNDIDLNQRLIGIMNQEHGTQINFGTYGGYIIFLFKIGKTQYERIVLKYFHGSGGGGPVTKGVIQSNRQAVIYPDADIVVNGHIHESWVVTLARERLSQKGVVERGYQYHVRTPTYKDEYRDGADGWAVEKGMPPKPIGAVWLRIWHYQQHMHIQLMQDVR